MEIDYLESTYYQIRLTAKYLKLFIQQMFNKLNLDISLDEFITLEILKKDSKICQRDLAKLLLKDRANTGRICNSLQEKKYINILVESKKNRPVKNLVLTQTGEKYLQELSQKLKPLFSELMKYYDKEEEQRMQAMLKQYREIITKIIDIQI